MVTLTVILIIVIVVAAIYWWISYKSNEGSRQLRDDTIPVFNPKGIWNYRTNEKAGSQEDDGSGCNMGEEVQEDIIKSYTTQDQLSRLSFKKAEVEDDFEQRIGRVLKEKALLEDEIILNHRAEISESITKYVPVLVRKYEQLVYQDEYGDWVFDDWWKECDLFAETKMRMLLLRLGRVARKKYLTWNDSDDLALMRKIVDKYVDEYLEGSVFAEAGEVGITVNTDNPIQFEEDIANLFKLKGWDASTTKGSGDQGADVLARKGEALCIVQCKLYSQPVGNKAVQEVYSAKQYYKGDLAIVVTNADFTKSARQLASSCDVALLHYLELNNFIDLLGE